MMHNDFNSEKSREENRRGAESVEGSRPMSDREVPLPSRKEATSVMHQWLDGEIPEAAVRAVGGEREVRLWNALGTELEVRRQIAAPVGLADRIMAALPQNTPTVITPWYSRPLEVTPAVAAGMGATLLAFGLALGVLLAS